MLLQGSYLDSFCSSDSPWMCILSTVADYNLLSENTNLFLHSVDVVEWKQALSQPTPVHISKTGIPGSTALWKSK